MKKGHFILAIVFFLVSVVFAFYFFDYVDLPKMLELLMEHGIKGNVTLKQQQRSLEYVERLLES